MGTSKLSGKPDEMLGVPCDGPGGSNTPSRFVLRKLVKLRWRGPLARMQHFRGRLAWFFFANQQLHKFTNVIYCFRGQVC